MRRANLCRRFVLCEAARRWNVGIIGTCVISSVYSTNAPPCPGPLFMLDLITWHASKKFTVALQRRISRTGKVPEIKKKKNVDRLYQDQNIHFESFKAVEMGWNGKREGRGGDLPETSWPSWCCPEESPKCEVASLELLISHLHT